MIKLFRAKARLPTQTDLRITVALTRGVGNREPSQAVRCGTTDEVWELSPKLCNFRSANHLAVELLVTSATPTCQRNGIGPFLSSTLRLPAKMQDSSLTERETYI